jgi:glucokinase
MGDDSPCLCGRRGCLEVYASGTALERFARVIADEEPAVNPRPEAAGGFEARPADYGAALRELRDKGELEGEEVGRLALEGDAAACAAVAKVARWLGVGMANFANIFNPDIIVVGGGLSNLGDLLLAPATEVMRQMAISPNGEAARVKAAELGNTAGVVGAALVAWEELG